MQEARRHPEISWKSQLGGVLDGVVWVSLALILMRAGRSFEKTARRLQDPHSCSRRDESLGVGLKGFHAHSRAGFGASRHAAKAELMETCHCSSRQRTDVCQKERLKERTGRTVAIIKKKEVQE